MGRSAGNPCMLRGTSNFAASCADGSGIIAVFGGQSGTHRLTHAGPVEPTAIVVSIRKLSLRMRLRLTLRAGAGDLLLHAGEQSRAMAPRRIRHALSDKHRDSGVGPFAISVSRARIQVPAPVTSDRRGEHKRGRCQP